MEWLERYRWAIALVLVALIVAGGVLLFQGRPWADEPVEVVLASPTPALAPGVEVYVAGAVVNPGWYSLEGGDAIADAVMAAGGVREGGDPARLKLYCFSVGEGDEPQRVDLNRAPAWLLEALPGIGPALAQAIIDHRDEHGPFQRIEELKEVSGIGEATYEAIRDLVTVE